MKYLKRGWRDLSLLRLVYQPLINMVFAASWHKLKNKYTEGYDERRGIQSPEKLLNLGGKRPLWVHGVSVGEVQAAVPLIKEARKNGYTGPVLLSTTTETGKAMALRIGSGLFDVHIYYPWDKKTFVCSALDTIKPWAFVTTETELWPNMLWELKERNIPSFLMNGRISDRTWARLNGKMRRKVGAELYSLFTEMFVRDQRDAQRLNEIGVQKCKISVCGDSKIDALLTRKNPAAVEAWVKKIGLDDRPVFIAGSTHTGEDEVILSAFVIVRESIPDARLLIAPRHPDRAPSIEALSADKFRTCLLSDLCDGWEVLVIDMIGVLFELYGFATAAFVGGSFVDKGGQNILEPVSWGVPVQYGPHMEDFAEASNEFISLGIANQVENSEQLAKIWLNIAGRMNKSEYYRELSEKYFAEKAGAAFKTWAAISKYAQ